MSEYIIWHNSRCSKSRQTLDLLEKAGVDFTTRNYLEDVPSEDEIKAVLKKVGIGAEELVRKKEELFKGFREESKNFDEAKWIKMLHENPKLIERPIVIHGDSAVIGRPPSNVESIL